MPEGRTETEAFEVWPVGKHHYRHEKDILEMPEGWVFVESGDAALTRRIKAQSEHWVVMGRYRNRVTAQGLCAPEKAVSEIRAELEAERSDPAYQKKLEAGRRYRDAKQQDYVAEFEQEVLAFLNFDARWSELAHALAHAVTAHATPVGSGTVARTKRISVEDRAEAAVIAWLRHQTSSYDRMSIPRVAGARREVRRKIAEVSREILDKYRSGAAVDLSVCPLAKALGFGADGACEK